MSTSTALDRQVAEEQERHDLLQQLTARGVTVDPNMSLEGLEEMWATFGTDAQAENAKIEPAPIVIDADHPGGIEGAMAEAADAITERVVEIIDPDGTLFDRSQYEREDLAIAKVDGQQIDKIRVKFSGSILLDRSDPADVALYNRLTMGKEVELRCAGKVTAVGAGWTTNRDGDLDAIVGEKAIKVETVWVLAPEELKA